MSKIGLNLVLTSRAVSDERNYFRADRRWGISPAVRLVIPFLLLARAGTGCARVKPIERGNLASPCLALAPGEDGFAGACGAEILESKTGGGLPSATLGEECGCAQ